MGVWAATQFTRPPKNKSHDTIRPEVTVPASLQPDTVAWLMASFRNGDHEAAGRLVELFYPFIKEFM